MREGARRRTQGEREEEKRRWRPQRSYAATTPLASGGRHWRPEAERARSVRGEDERQRPSTVGGGGEGVGGGEAGEMSWQGRQR